MIDRNKKQAFLAHEEAIGLSGIKNLAMNNKLPLALKSVNEFIDKFPDNKYAILEKGRILSYMGFSEEAVSVLESLEKDFINFFDDRDKLSLYKALVFSYFDSKNYEGVIRLVPYVLCYNKYLDNYREFINYYIIAKRELNILDKNAKKLVKDQYLESQIMNYNEKRAIGHIYNHKNDKEETSYFDKNINIRKLYHLIKNRISEDCEPFSSNRIVEYYHFYCPNVGYQNGVVSNHIEVVALTNTNNIITMYPVVKNTINSYSLYKEKIQVKKRISQIDKFNNRYKNIL